MGCDDEMVQRGQENVIPETHDSRDYPNPFDVGFGEPMISVYVLVRAGAVLNVHSTLAAAQKHFPGEWREGAHPSIKAANEWYIGDARILRLPVLP